MCSRSSTLAVLVAILLQFAACARLGFEAAPNLDANSAVDAAASADAGNSDLGRADAAPSDRDAFDSGSVDLTSDANPIALSVEPLYPRSGANMLDYVARDAQRELERQADAPCNPVGWSYHHECLHGGEFRKVVVTGHSRCQGLSMEDRLGVFDWVCSEAAVPVFFYSAGFKRGKGLKDVLTADAFVANRVILKRGATQLGDSAVSSSWWGNAITPLTLNSSDAAPALELSASGTLYTIPTSADSRGIVIKADKVGLVVLEGAVLGDAASSALDCNFSTSGAQPCLIFAETGHFGWIEGEIAASLGQEVIVQGQPTLTTTSRWRYHRLRISAMGGSSTALYIHTGDGALVSDSEIEAQSSAAWVRTAKNTRLQRVRLSSLAPVCLIIGVNAWHTFVDQSQIVGGTSRGIDADAWHITIANSRIYNSAGTGVRGPFAKYFHLVNSIVANHDAGGILVDNESVSLLHVTVANNGGAGLLVEDNGFQPSGQIEGLVSLNNATGVELQSDQITVSNLYSGYNDRGVVVGGSSTDSVFTNALMLGQNGVDCRVTSTGLLPGLTASSGSCGLNGASDAVITTDVVSAGYYVGAVSSDGTNAQASGAVPRSALVDWFGFDNERRLWGRDAGYGDARARGACGAADTCRIWDWTQLPAAVELHGVHGSLVPDAPCPDSAHGDQVVEYPGLGGQPAYALRHAVEILGDWRGNENGYCDSNERCLFTPHIGAGQGSGALSGPCRFQNGVGTNAVSGVSLHFYR